MRTKKRQVFPHSLHPEARSGHMHQPRATQTLAWPSKFRSVLEHGTI